LKTIKSTSSRKSIGLSPSWVESVWVQAVDFKSTSSRIQVKSSRIGGLKSLPGLLMLANPRDAFSRQSRSPYMVPFNMSDMVSY